MKTDIKQITSGEDTLILRYKELTPVIKKIFDALNGKDTKITGRKDDRRIIINPEDILYIESVDDKTFACTRDDVFRMEYSLQGMLIQLDDIRFFRCGKSMIINIDKVSSLKSLSSNRIDAMLENGEHIIISRAYASEFRKLLKGGSSHG